MSILELNVEVMNVRKILSHKKTGEIYFVVSEWSTPHPP